VVTEPAYDVVSGDGHLEVPPDRWLTHVPDRFKDLAPRLVKLPSGGEGWLVEGSPLIHNGTNLAAGRPTLRFRNVSYWDADGMPAPGTGDPPQRLAEQDEDGISAEILYPPVFISRCIEAISEAAAYRAMVAAYNEFVAEYCSYAPARLVGVGVIPITSVEDATAELRHIHQLGLRGVCPRAFPNGSGNPTTSDDLFWRTAVELGIGVTPHSSLGGGGNRAAFVQSATGRVELATVLPARASSQVPSVLAQLVTSGVFDRIPELRIYMAETNAAWLPHALFMLDDSYALYREPYGLDLPLRPSEYILEHVLFGIVRDPVVLKMLDLVPADRLIWGSDFPHSVGSWPKSSDWIEDAFVGVPTAARRRITRDNVVEFFGLAGAQAGSDSDVSP
jgi:uncharacterized protein